MKISKEKKDELDIREICAFCENASCLWHDEGMLCHIRGIVSPDDTCKKFRYDLLKRKPGKKMPLPSAEPLPSLDDDD